MLTLPSVSPVRSFHQTGASLFEVLVALVIFSFASLALGRYQLSAIKEYQYLRESLYQLVLLESIADMRSLGLSTIDDYQRQFKQRFHLSSDSVVAKR